MNFENVFLSLSFIFIWINPHFIADGCCISHIQSGIWCKNVSRCHAGNMLIRYFKRFFFLISLSFSDHAKKTQNIFHFYFRFWWRVPKNIWTNPKVWIKLIFKYTRIMNKKHWNHLEIYWKVNWKYIFFSVRNGVICNWVLKLYFNMIIKRN